GDYPFNLSDVNYTKVQCLVVEDMHFNKLVTHEFMRPGMKKSDMDDVVAAFKKVWGYRNEL
ncbi:MAG: DegT/DnrJ/EryC1/StrS family aminotransferase, partial [Candidatus Cloacimonadota bacterium]|nr:DegT/DnrJ/EryC1/StrS family aminotransferase [Candidatus Cloacimonadota bacterium]